LLIFQDNWITPEVFGEIVYENFLFDIPKVLDLCALYGHCNAALLGKMVTNIFTHQRKYLQDLSATVPTLMEVRNSKNKSIK
jgi:activating signal cointegrator complex subunit 2